MTLNRVMIIGNLTRDPEVRVTPSGTSVAQIGVATNRVWTNSAGQRQEEVEFHHVVAWGKLAEICQKYLGKGRKVFVEGRLKSREWVGQDGVKRNRTEIIAENMIMLDRAPAGNAAAQGQNAGTAPSFANAPAAPRDTSAPMEEEIKVEDIPF